LPSGCWCASTPLNPEDSWGLASEVGADRVTFGHRSDGACRRWRQRLADQASFEEEVTVARRERCRMRRVRSTWMHLDSFGFVTASLIGALLSIEACGSNESAVSTSGGACRSACARCGGDLCVDCAGTADRYRDEYEMALYSCVNEADGCSASTWSACSTQAVGSAPRRPTDDTYRDACMTKRTDCAGQGINFADDNCLGSSLLSDEWLQKANDCLAKSCADASTCLRDIFK